MASAKLTIAGMYNYNPALFDEMSLPVIPTAEMLGLPDDALIPEAYQNLMKINLADLVGKICLDSAGFSTLYMDADLMKILIGVWSRTRIQTWQRLYNTFFLRYNPIWNKDAFTSRTHDDSVVKDIEQTSTNDNRIIDSRYGKDKGYDMVRGFDDGAIAVDMDPDVHPLDVPYYTNTIIRNTNTNGETEQSVARESGNNMGEHTPVSPKSGTTSTAVQARLNVGGGSLIESSSGNINTGTANYAGVGKDSTVRQENETTREYGNIGVTTAQQMIESERALAMNNLYETISREFVKKFCIMVY